MEGYWDIKQTEEESNKLLEGYNTNNRLDQLDKYADGLVKKIQESQKFLNKFPAYYNREMGKCKTDEERQQRSMQLASQKMQAERTLADSQSALDIARQTMSEHGRTLSYDQKQQNKAARAQNTARVMGNAVGFVEGMLGFGGNGQPYGYGPPPPPGYGPPPLPPPQAAQQPANGGTAQAAQQPAQPQRDSDHVTAQKVIAGQYGNGDARVKALTDAGYNYDKIQTLVDQYANDPDGLKAVIAKEQEQAAGGAAGNAANGQAANAAGQQEETAAGGAQEQGQPDSSKAQQPSGQRPPPPPGYGGYGYGQGWGGDPRTQGSYVWRNGRFEWQPGYQNGQGQSGYLTSLGNAFGTYFGTALGDRQKGIDPSGVSASDRRVAELQEQNAAHLQKASQRNMQVANQNYRDEANKNAAATAAQTNQQIMTNKGNASAGAAALARETKEADYSTMMQRSDEQFAQGVENLDASDAARQMAEGSRAAAKERDWVASDTADTNAWGRYLSNPPNARWRPPGPPPPPPDPPVNRGGGGGGGTETRTIETIQEGDGIDNVQPWINSESGLPISEFGEKYTDEYLARYRDKIFEQLGSGYTYDELGGGLKPEEYEWMIKHWNDLPESNGWKYDGSEKSGTDLRYEGFLPAAVKYLRTGEGLPKDAAEAVARAKADPEAARRWRAMKDYTNYQVQVNRKGKVTNQVDGGSAYNPENSNADSAAVEAASFSTGNNPSGTTRTVEVQQRDEGGDWRTVSKESRPELNPETEGSTSAAEIAKAVSDDYGASSSGVRGVGEENEEDKDGENPIWDALGIRR